MEYIALKIGYLWIVVQFVLNLSTSSHMLLFPLSYFFGFSVGIVGRNNMWLTIMSQYVSHCIGKFRLLTQYRNTKKAGVCIPILVTTFPEWLSGTEPLPCVHPRCVCSVLRAHAQFCRFNKTDATADVQ